MGVCGVGMAGLAYLFKARGWTVDGCDAARGGLARWLEFRGIRVRQGHDPQHLRARPDLVVRTAAVRPDAPEIRAAVRAGIPVRPRGEVLPLLLDGRLGVAVGGTHGKTTTTSLVTRLLLTAGLDPSWCIGGENPDIGGVAGSGAGGVLVVEADESDGTLARYRPAIAVITNVDFDHMEHFESVEAFEAVFRRFVANTYRRVIYCRDDARATAIAAASPLAFGYGLGPEADLRAVRVTLTAAGSRFDVVLRGRRLGRVAVPLTGEHNVCNALAAMAVALELGVGFKTVSGAFRRVSLPKRRFELVAHSRALRVISDYAHHPAELAALVAAARRLPARRLRAVFQPHRYTRTLALGGQFPAAFEGVDEVVLLPVYAASEDPLTGGTTWDLYTHFRRWEGAAGAEAGRPRVYAAASLEQAWEWLRLDLRRGDVLLVVGAGSVERIAGWARDEFGDHPRAARNGTFAQVRFDPREAPLSRDTRMFPGAPLGRRTTYGVGGTADWLVEPASEADLSALLAWAGRAGCPLSFVGAGSNLLVSDLGVRGVVVSLRASAFRGITIRGSSIIAGAGTSLSALLDAAQRAGLTGLEFLESIPGTVGGALRMNAGAWGHALCERVRWIQCLNRDGSPCTVRADALRAEYRRCGALDSRVAVGVALDLARGRVSAIRAERLAIREKRRWMRGLRCAGSVFRNPRAGDSAGRLIDRAGLKGTRVGGATVSTRHANVIVTEAGARASDVGALLERVRGEVRSATGVVLEPEIVLLQSLGPSES